MLLPKVNLEENRKSRVIRIGRYSEGKIRCRTTIKLSPKKDDEKQFRPF